MEGILSNVKKTIFPFEENIRAELLKFNIYQEGDFFVEHRDTPLRADAVGSLVIALPTAHTGGRLIVKHRENQVTYDFAKEFEHKLGYSNLTFDELLKEGKYCFGQMHFKGRSYSFDEMKYEEILTRCGLARPYICYAAFYGDALHEIQQIWRGVRITLSYQLIRVKARQ